jgi:hypothetical protein
MLIEQEITVFKYLIDKNYKFFSRIDIIPTIEFKYIKINSINNMKEYYEVINNPNLSFNIKPSKKWFLKFYYVYA